MNGVKDDGPGRKGKQCLFLWEGGDTNAWRWQEAKRILVKVL